MTRSLESRIEKLERASGADDVTPCLDWTGMFSDDLLTDEEKLALLEETRARVGPGRAVRVLCWADDEHLIPDGARITTNGFVISNPT